MTLLIISCGSDDDNTQQPDGSLYTVSTLVRNLNGSGDLAVDDNGNIYVADFGNKLNNADGTIVTKLLLMVNNLYLQLGYRVHREMNLTQKET